MPNYFLKNIEANVDRTIRRDDVNWGRTLATFLAGQTAKLDEAFGKSAIRLPNLRKQEYERRKWVVHHMVRTHPEWTREQIGEALGLAVATVNRYVKLMEPVEPTPPKPKPKRSYKKLA